MLSLTRIEDGACYVCETTKLYVAWSMLCYSSKMFWGCETIKELDRAKSLSDRAFIHFEPGAFSELIELFQHIESSLLDAVRIAICFENYFKAKLLLENYIIHQMDINVCRKQYPQFMTGKTKQKLLQKSTPILLKDIKQAEEHDGNSIEPLQTLNKQTIGMGLLLGQPKYLAVYSKEQVSDSKPFSLLRSLNRTRNTLHFLNIEYIASGGMAVDDFVYLRDYVSTHIDTLAEKILNDNKPELDIGKMEIDRFLSGYV